MTNSSTDPQTSPRAALPATLPATRRAMRGRADGSAKCSCTIHAEELVQKALALRPRTGRNLVRASTKNPPSTIRPAATGCAVSHVPERFAH